MAFARNRRARAFYAREGFQEVAFGDGSDNEEGEPDIQLNWVPRPATEEVCR
ncbi:hypothetical protein [Teichococcus deserti]|jgi:hypothetical protein|uniref:hypothetical protein n=1 Tax=Teichococcus deserti TaxID=1817963 RepID=UPI0013F65F9D|nr:hypothetical protein [Pseudoroseomonas deserti]